MPKAYRYFTPMSSWTSNARRTFFSSSASIHTRPRHPSDVEEMSTLWDDGRRHAELVSARLTRDTIQFDDLHFELSLAIARPFVVGVAIVWRRVPAEPTSLRRPRCRDDTRASRDLSPASFRRAHIDEQARSNVSRQLRRRVRGVARRSNNWNPLHVASSCVAVDRVGHPRTDEVRLKLEKIISVQSSRCWAKRTSDLVKRANVSVATAATALPLKPLAEWRNIYTT